MNYFTGEDSSHLITFLAEDSSVTNKLSEDSSVRFTLQARTPRFEQLLFLEDSSVTHNFSEDSSVRIILQARTPHI